MFTYRLLIPIIAFNCCLFNINNALINPPLASSSAQNPDSLNKNLTCEEFCAISKASSGTFRRQPGYYHQHNNDEELPQQLVIKEQIFRGTRQPLNEWLHQSSRHRTLANEDYLRQSSIIFGLTQIANEDYLSPACFRNLKELGKAVLRKDVWAMKGRYEVTSVWFRIFFLRARLMRMRMVSGFSRAGNSWGCWQL